MKNAYIIATLFSAVQIASAAVIDITPSNGNVPITQVVYTISGVDFTQSAPASGVESVGTSSVNIKEITVNDSGTLTALSFANTHGAIVRNLNPELANISGIGVYENGNVTVSLNNASAFESALAATTYDTNIRNLVYYDHLSPSNPTLGIPDFDVLFKYGASKDDYIFVAERWGNTFFEMTPLDANGNVIVGANTLRFGGPSEQFTGYGVYDWNSGFAATGNRPDQAQAFSITSTKQFFTGTGINPTTIFGFRVDNDGEADVKFMMLSETTFIPEPTSAILFSIASMVFVLRRRR